MARSLNKVAILRIVLLPMEGLDMEPEQSLIPLGEGSTDREVVGGKAAVLGLLAGVGYAVPPGFVMTAPAR